MNIFIAYIWRWDNILYCPSYLDEVKDMTKILIKNNLKENHSSIAISSLSWFQALSQIQELIAEAIPPYIGEIEEIRFGLIDHCFFVSEPRCVYQPEGKYC